MNKKLLIVAFLLALTVGKVFSMQENKKKLYIEYTKVTEKPTIEFKFKTPSPRTDLPLYAQNRIFKILKHINPAIKITHS